MGCKFDTWLAKPGTLHLLRRLIANEPSKTCCQSSKLNKTQRRVQKRSYTATSCARKEARTEADVVRTSLPFHLRDFGLEAEEERRRYSVPRSHQPRLHQEDRKIPWRKILHDGLDSFERLRFQADVNSPRTHSKRLVDQPEYMHDIDLWSTLLLLRVRIDGDKGVHDVWKGMQKREVSLPTKGEHASTFWPAFVRCAIAPYGQQLVDPEMMQEVFDHAKTLKENTGEHYAPLHNLVVGRQLRLLPMYALKWHVRLQDHGLSSPNSLADLADDVLLSDKTEIAAGKFKRIYRRKGERNLYDRWVCRALELHKLPMALQWHQFFVQHNDTPSDALAASDQIRELKDLADLHPTTSTHQRQHHTSEQLLPTSRFPPLTRASMNEIVGEVHGIKPKELSDNFCARIFATRAFSVGFAIKSLTFLGVEHISSLALRELAARSDSVIDFSNKLRELKTAEINVTETVFCRLLQRVTKEGAAELFKAIIESDQHPEAFEDAGVQEKLLRVFLERGQHVQAHLSLMAMSILNVRSSEAGWNAVIQHYAATRNFGLTALTMQQLQDDRLPLMSRTFACLRLHLLPRRNPGKRPVQVQRKKDIGFDVLDFLTSAAIYSQQLGLGTVQSRHWLELLKRYGMEHRFDDVERLILWLVHFDSHKTESVLGHSSRPGLLQGICDNDEPGRLMACYSLPFKFRRTVQKVLNKQTLQAIVTWSFRAASVRRQLRPALSHTNHHETTAMVSASPRCEPWARGLLLLRKVKDEGSNVPLTWVKQALIGRLWVLFGPAFSTLAINNEMQRRNQLSLAHYIKHANEIWGEPKLFDIPSSYLDALDDGSIAVLTHMVFGQTRRVSRKRREYVDINDWLATRGSTRVLELQSIRQKHRVWARSPLRKTMSAKASSPWRVTSRRVRNFALVKAPPSYI